MIKFGHQAPKRWRYNKYFNHILIRGDLHYCQSHDFVYDCVEEKRKLYNAEPCYYTDNRYVDTQHNYFRDCYLYWSRSFWNASISLKSCIRRTLKCRNIPVGTIVKFTRDWYCPKKKIDLSYNFKIRKENLFDPQYEINMAKYERNFDSCERSQQLTDALRANGFLVGVSKGNPDFISGMISTAAAYANGKPTEINDDGGQIAIAYGHGRMIGFSSGENSFRGYGNGCENVLYDYFGEFNKWSQAIEIHKSTPIDDIIKELTDDTARE